MNLTLLIPDEKPRGDFCRGVRWIKKQPEEHARLYCEHGVYKGAVPGAFRHRCQFCAAGIPASKIGAA